MKARIKRTLSVILTLLMLISVVPLSSSAVYATGDIIEFGSYPQAREEGDAFGAMMDMFYGNQLNWISYGYYYGTGTGYDSGLGSQTKSDYMKYADFTYNGAKYRAVLITSFRPNKTNMKSDPDCSHQDESSYLPNDNMPYLFKFEPIRWRVLNPETGLMMTEKVLDTQAYSNFFFGSDPYYNNAERTNAANDYETSSIRAWLNNDFYNTAFSQEEKALVGNTAIENSLTDKVFLPSESELSNAAYGYASSSAYDNSRVAYGTDYAKSQNLSFNTSNNMYYNKTSYFTRTAGRWSEYASKVISDGRITNALVHECDSGVRPAICKVAPHVHSYTNYVYNNDATCTQNGTETAACDNGCTETDTREKANSALGHAWNDGVITTASTCIEIGVKTFTCARCSGTKTEAVSATGHTVVTDAAVAATCTATGLTEGSHCSVCKAVIVAQTETPKLAHTVVTDTAVAATCTVTGLTEGSHCSVCKAVIVAQTETPKLAHTVVTDTAVAATCTATGLTEGSHCSVCKAVIVAQTETPALGHAYNDGVITTAATCTVSGIKTFTCARCHDTKTEVIAATAHASAYSVSAVAATCTQTGFTDGRYCPDCNTWLSGHEQTAKLNHNDANHDGKCDSCGTSTADPNCSCICHSSGFMQFIYKIVNFFWKLFSMKKYCDCGIAHY